MMPVQKKGKRTKTPSDDELKIRMNNNKYGRFLLDSSTTNVITPNKQDKEYVLESLRSFVPRLKSLFTTSLIDNYHLKNEEHDDNGWYQDSYREINGGRFEMRLFCKFIDDHFGRRFSKDLSSYAQRSALQDKRVHQLPNHYFTKWSFIISRGNVAAQDIHIDVPANNFQFGVILQDGDAGTVVMERHDGPDTAEDLLEHVWGINMKYSDFILSLIHI